jgi:hypothetical protein
MQYMIILNFFRKGIAGLCFGIASILGILGIIALKLGNDFVEIGIKTSPNE